MLCRADVQLNAWALFLAASHEDALSGSGSEFEADWASLGSNQAPVWRAALEAQLVQDAQAARQANRGQPYSDWNTLAWARWVAIAVADCFALGVALSGWWVRYNTPTGRGPV